MASQKWIRFRSVLSSYAIVSCLIAVALNFLSFYGSRVLFALMEKWGILTFHDLTIPWIDGFFERNAPDFRWFMLIYVMYFVYWLGGYWILAGQERRFACSAFAAVILGEIVVTLIFILFPTSLDRPVLEEGDVRTFWDWLTRFIYASDPPNNLFPSLHCYNSWMVFRYALKCKGLPKGYKLFCALACPLICASTMFVRQHLFADVVSAIALAELCMFLESKMHAGRLLERLEQVFRKEKPV